MFFTDKAKWEPVLIAIWQISIIFLQQRCLSQKKEYWIILSQRNLPNIGIIFYNLIPSCPSCNDVQHKSNKDVTSNKGDASLTSMRIINPYEYQDRNFFFDYNLKSHWENAENSDVDILTAGDKEVGYNALLNLNGRYNTIQNRETVISIIRKLNRYPDTYFDYLNMLPIPACLIKKNLMIGDFI